MNKQLETKKQSTTKYSRLKMLHVPTATAVEAAAVAAVAPLGIRKHPLVAMMCIM
jgi:hypothetical protein